ncbi:hypothetical protein [Poseidonocella sp. HB161398]|nr:hypothetical protein [Poseidonocella sp. HB161398]
MSTDQSHVSPESAIPGFSETDDLPADTSTPGIVSAGRALLHKSCEGFTA